MTDQNWQDLRQRLIGLGEQSSRKSYYPELQKKLAELKESEERFHTIFNAVGDAIFIHDAISGKILDINQRVCEMYGMTREEAMQIHLVDDPERTPPYTDDDARRWLKAAAAGSAQVFEWQARHKDGHFFWVEVNMRPALINRRNCVVVSVRDIGKRKRAEDDRLQLERQLLHVQKLESLGVLAGGIAHDFNNLLAAIIGNTELAKRRIPSDSPVVTNLGRIEIAAERAAELARQMLAYSGKGKFIIETIDLNQLLEEMLHMLEVSISKHAVLHFDLHPALPAIEADIAQLHQIVMNLVINASEAIGNRSGTIRITTGWMDYDSCYLVEHWREEKLLAGRYVSLEIADTGCGMDQDTLTKLFDPFFTTKFTGRGLGMSAVLGIVRGHKGAINVDSTPGEGTCFHLLFPASDQPVRPSARSVVTNWQGQGLILLVDDEETVRNIGSDMLRELGYEVLTATDGRNAIELFARHPEICGIILDLTMPHMNGIQCFNALRQRSPQVKVIMSSGYNEQDVTQQLEGQGLAGFIQKPYKLNTLREILQQSL